MRIRSRAFPSAKHAQDISAPEHIARGGRGRALLTDKVRSVEHTVFNDDNGETIADSCLMERSLTTRLADAPLSDALPTMMGECCNRILLSICVPTHRVRGPTYGDLHASIT